MYYFHVFDSNQEYTDLRYDSYKEPWIGVMRASSGNVTFNRDELEQPLTFIIKTTGNLYWKYTGNTSYAKTIEYRIWNNKRQASEWISVTAATGGAAIPVTAGDRVEFRGDNETYASSDGSSWNGFDPTGKTSAQFDVCGNIMSLIQKEGFETLDTLTQPHALRNMFIRSNVVDASKLILPATGLTDYCYATMFKGCSLLNGAPELPATVLAQFCYQFMFQSCTALETAPDLPAPVLVKNCYTQMFRDCSSLNYIKCLATDISASECVKEWMSGVSATGTFVKASGMSGWGTGISGIPNGWTVQEAGSLTLSIKNVSCPDSGQTVPVTVTSSGGWTATSDSSWITLSPNTGGTGNTSVNVVVAGGTLINRTGHVTFTSLNVSETLTVSQSAGEETGYTKYDSAYIAHSEILRIPNSLGIRAFNESASYTGDWGYQDGIFLKAVMDVYDEYNSQSYNLSPFLDYVSNYYSNKINNDGTITRDSRNYEVYTATELDDKEPGMALFKLYDETGLSKYKSCLDMLYNGFSIISANTDGVYWHKVGYPNQCWLDGLYMAHPFRAEYAKRYLTGTAQTAVYDDVVYQITKAAEKTYDSVTGLYRHAYDASGSAKWIDPNSLNGKQAYYAWGRGMGWMMMAIVDVLEILPTSHTGRTQLTNVLSGVCTGLLSIRDANTGVWRNVPTEGAAAGNGNENGFEASSSAMFAYAWLKGVRLGYLPASQRANAISIYNSVKSTFITTGSVSGEAVLNYANVVKGGNPGGDNTTKQTVFNNYCSRDFMANNTHGVAPLIYAALEYERLTNS